MIENKYIRFDPSCWGYEFTCVRCGANASTEGEAPLSAVDAMREKGWTFHLENNTYRPICPACDHSGGDST
jgi:hypothetical protein